MTRGTHMQLLGELPLMLEFDEDLRRRVCEVIDSVSEPICLEAGTVLFAEGADSSETGYVLLLGRVAVRKSSGASTVTRAPALMGEVKQFMRSETRTATLTMQGEGEVLRFEWPRLYAALAASLSEGERAQFRDALHGYAWTHLVDDEG